MDEVRAIVFFDGVCNLCNGAVRFIIKHDHEDKFKFSSLQSSFGKEIRSRLSNQEKMKSIIVKNGDLLLTKSTAVLYIASQLGYPFKLIALGYIIPKFMRDIVYDWVADSRYKWFGKTQECMIPTPELKERFVEV